MQPTPKAIVAATRIAGPDASDMPRSQIVRGIERMLMASGATRSQARGRIDRISQSQFIEAAAQPSDDISADLDDLLAAIRS
ncbi:hypothetical protein [Neorhizobium sp. DAR64860/K0K1]|uniref:hypothetical protein n=1 Tax=Neorhizobium sp. DAR64860/K0K1 TaxID=3421955 RepID=UPI003D2E2080